MPRNEHVTATGWRIVGAAIPLARAADQYTLDLRGDADILFAARFTVRPRLGNPARVVDAILPTLDAAMATSWPDAPPLTRNRPMSSPAQRFAGARWEPSGPRGAWNGHLAWRHPHPVLAGISCITSVVIVEQETRVDCTIRVACEGGLPGRGFVGAGQARPAFLTSWAQQFRLIWDGQPADPQPLGEHAIREFVRDVLLSDTREEPVAVLAPFEEGGYALPPDELAVELLGLAHLYVIDRHRATYLLSDTLGDRRLSCYWGALRVYMPGFSCADNPVDHPVLVRERLVDPVIRAELVGRLGRAAAQGLASSSRPAPVPEDPQDVQVSSPLPAGPPSPTAAVATPATPAPAPVPEPPRKIDTSPLLNALLRELGSLSGTIASLVEANTALTEEIARLRTTTAVRAASTTALERRLDGMEGLLRTHFEPPRPVDTAETVFADDTAPYDEDDSPSLVEVVRQAATSHSDALLILEAAERSAVDSPYEDPERLAVVLDAMAAVARRRMEGALGSSLRTAFRELGIDYRGGIAPTTSDKQRQQYELTTVDGATYSCYEHLVLGNSYDPRYCLRVYFTSRAPMEPRFVIGHVGRHFDVRSTT